MRAKLTEELIQQMTSLKGDGLSNKDICRAVGIHEATLYRWLSKPSGRLHRALGESLKKAEADCKRTLLTTIREAATKKNGQWTAAAWLLGANIPTSTHRLPVTRASAPRRLRRLCSAWRLTR